MKAPIKHAFGFAFAVLVTLAVLVLQPLAPRTSIRLTGAVMPNSTHTHTYADKPVRTLSVGGERWRTWGETEGASAYHALVILPPVPFGDGVGASGGMVSPALTLKRGWCGRGHRVFTKRKN